MKRRTYLRMAGGIAGAATIGGAGLFVTTGGAAAAGASITANDTSLTNDDGAVKEVFIDPALNIKWENFDDAVGAISIFIEAKVEDDDAPTGPNSGFFPLHRSEPVLLPGGSTGMSTVEPGTTGSFTIGPFSDLEGNRADGDDWSNATTEDGDLRVADAEVGAPDYSDASEGYLQGGNVSDATIPDDEPLVNGEYGAASGTAVFEAEEGSTKETDVTLRYTIQFLELGIDHFKTITDYDLIDNSDGTIGGVRDELDRLYDAVEGEWDTDELDDAGHLTDVEPEDITVGAVTDGGDFTTDPEEPITWETNLKLPVMTGPDAAYPYLPNPTSRHAADARDYDSEEGEGPVPVILSDTATFTVTVKNEEATSSATSDGDSNGDSNTGTN